MTAIPFNYKCKTCANRGVAQNNVDACAKFKIPINVEKDFCAWHTNMNTTVCAFCRSIENITIFTFEGKPLPVCASCVSKIYSCATCADASICGFKSDHSEPQVVVQRVQQGFMTVQQQVKNPHLIAKHCPTCRCCHEPGASNTCLKDLNGEGCPNWRIQTALLQEYSL